MYIKENFIFDDEGRTLILRGVNLGGDCKIPYCKPGEEVLPEFLDKKTDVSFIGRPFPLEDAKDHFCRLKKAGMTFLRFLITWEAVEHEGPGIYDEAYLAYLRKILLIAEEEGISIFIDTHQDVWSRWTGGDGAPSWTMEKLGMNLEVADRCGAALTRQRYSTINGKPYPKMIWPGNYNRYAAATMFSLFFAGRTYAPDLKIEGKNIQDYLVDHYIAALKHVKRRLKNCAAIAGWGVMNEPHYGFIGLENLETADDYMIPVGPRISPWQAMQSASGYTVDIPVYSAISVGKRISGYQKLNPDGVSFFKDGFSCPWKQAGVWVMHGDTPELLKKDHFSLYQNRAVNFADDFLKPFTIKYIDALNETDEKTLFFIEGTPSSTKSEAHPSWGKDDPSNAVNAFHWYDGFSLFTKSFRPHFTMDPDTAKFILGKKNVASFFVNCLAKGILWTKHKMNNMPSLLGEFGLAFDMNNRKGFKTGNYKLHEKALSMYYDAVDANLLHSTLWNYTASNTNKYGDGWNDEDLSVFSENKERAEAGWKRPYPMAAAGKIVSFKWDTKRRVFTFRYKADGNIKVPSIIYLPADLMSCPEIKTQDRIELMWEYKKETQQLLVFNADTEGKTCNADVEIKVRLN